MVKNIPTQQLRLGMYLQSMEGSWLSHPFWKTKFVLDDAADLKALLDSSVPSVWINVNKGCDVADHQPEPAASEPESAASEPVTGPALGAELRPLPASQPVPVQAATTPCSLGAELLRATALVASSRLAVTALFGEARLGKAISADDCLPLVNDIAASVSRNPSALISLARLKTKDDYTYMHSVAVCGLMVSLARQMGLGEADVREAGLAGLLHDVGKMMIPTLVLNKPGALTDAEFALMRSHPERGHQMLQNGAGVPAAALDVCLHHHEKIDGSGYPKKLKGDDISLLAKMGAVCDVYDAITSTRPYKNAWDPAGSIQRMSQWSGHFDPQVFKAFVRCIGIYPVGSLVKLESGRLAVVVDMNPAQLAVPVVRVFYSTKSKLPIPVQTLDLASPAAQDRIVGRESPHDWGFTHLKDIWTAA